MWANKDRNEARLWQLRKSKSAVNSPLIFGLPFLAKGRYTWLYAG
jgi:hypothetical protein